MLKGKELVEQTDTGLVKVKADMSKFVAETLGRDSYSKRSELTGKDGKDLPTPILSLAFNKDYEDKGTESKG